MNNYLNLLKEIKEKGTWKDAAREGMPRTLSLFGAQMRFDLSKGFPILTTKKVYFKNIVTELLWFLKGDTNIKYLVDNDCNIWNEDAYNYYKKKGHSAMNFEEFIQNIKDGNGDGDVGRSYGYQWRNFDSAYNKGVDQIANIINELRKDPMGRRHIINSWNPRDVENGYMALPPCHTFVQFNCRPLSFRERKDYWFHIRKPNRDVVDSYDDKSENTQIIDFDFMDIPRYKLDCHMYQRSADVFLGVPYNISSYSLLTEIIAKMCGMIPGDFIHSFGDVHIYDSHQEIINEQLKREPKSLPKLSFSKDINWEDVDTVLDSCTISDFILEEYEPYPALKGKLFTGLF